MAVLSTTTKGGLPYLGVPKMVIRASNGQTWTVPYAPKVTDMEQDGLNWVDSPRPGNTPFLRIQSVKPRRMRMEFTLGNNAGASIQSQIDGLRNIANKDVHVTISYSSNEAGAWRIIDLSYEVTRRNTANAPTQGKMTVTFQQVRLDSVVPGPVKATVAPAPKPSSSGGARTYRVVRGDTLWALAVKYYGSGLQWRRIADANGVRDPRKLQIGTLLRIP